MASASVDLGPWDLFVEAMMHPRDAPVTFGFVTFYLAAIVSIGIRGLVKKYNHEYGHLTHYEAGMEILFRIRELLVEAPPQTLLPGLQPEGLTLFIYAFMACMVLGSWYLKDVIPRSWKYRVPVEEVLVTPPRSVTGSPTDEISDPQEVQPDSTQASRPVFVLESTVRWDDKGPRVSAKGREARIRRMKKLLSWDCFKPKRQSTTANVDRQMGEETKEVASPETGSPSSTRVVVIDESRSGRVSAPGTQAATGTSESTIELLSPNSKEVLAPQLERPVSPKVVVPQLAGVANDTEGQVQVEAPSSAMGDASESLDAGLVSSTAVNSPPTTLAVVGEDEIDAGTDELAVEEAEEEGPIASEFWEELLGEALRGHSSDGDINIPSPDNMVEAHVESEGAGYDINAELSVEISSEASEDGVSEEGSLGNTTGLIDPASHSDEELSDEGQSDEEAASYSHTWSEGEGEDEDEEEEDDDEDDDEEEEDEDEDDDEEEEDEDEDDDDHGVVAPPVNRVVAMPRSRLAIHHSRGGGRVVVPPPPAVILAPPRVQLPSPPPQPEGDDDEGDGRPRKMAFPRSRVRLQQRLHEEREVVIGEEEQSSKGDPAPFNFTPAPGTSRFAPPPLPRFEFDPKETFKF